jgi:hypothetical protein
MRSHAEADSRVDHVALAPGSRVGRYEIEATLGQGGFGITYRARDTQLDRLVAIKEYLPAGLAIRQDGATVLPRSTEVAEDFDWGRQRFVEEGRTLAGLHAVPSIVQVFDFLEENGTAYMVMALIQGDTLERRIAALGTLGHREINAILGPLLDGLEKVHEAGFLHRDIKPANVLVDEDGKPILIDFGASRASLADRTATMTAIFTPGYAAAEQFSSARQGPATDIYGLAATLYHAITGAPPPSAVDRLLQDDCVPLFERLPAGFPRGLLRGIDAALSLHAGDRPQTVAAWRAILEQEGVDSAPTVVMEATASRTAAGPPEGPTVPTPPTPPSQPTKLAVGSRRYGVWKWLGLAAGVALVLAVGDYALYATRTPVGAAEATPGAPSAVAAAEPAAPVPATAAAESPPGQKEEAALQLGPEGRQRIQRALTALGFDTHGFDGAFGPRSRDMIGGWQRRNGQPPTGYLTADQHKELLREAKPLLDRGVEEKKTAPAAQPAVAGTFDASYSGSLTASATGGGQTALRPVDADLAVAGGYVTGRLIHAECGALPVLLAVDGAGAISGSLRVPEASSCTLNQASASGRIRSGTLSLEVRGVDVTLRGTLTAPLGPERRRVESPDPAGLRNNVP